MRSNAQRNNRHAAVWSTARVRQVAVVFFLGAMGAVQALEADAIRDQRWQWAAEQQVELLLVATDVRRRVAIVKTRSGDLQSLQPTARVPQLMIELISVERDSATFRPVKLDDRSGIERITIKRMKDAQITQVIRLTPPAPAGTIGWKVLTQ